MKTPVKDPREPLRLGLQQALLALPSIAALPLLMGLDASMALLCAGAGTLIFQYVTRSRIPVLLGSSYSFAYVLVSTAKAHGSAQAAGVAGLAGLVFVVAAVGLRLVPAPTLRRLLPAHVTATTVLVLGLALAPVAVQAAAGGTSPAVVDRVGPWGAWLVAGIALTAGVMVQLAFPRWGLRRGTQLPALAALAAGTLVALPLGIVDFTLVLKAPWVGLPHFSLPRIAPQLILTAVAVGLVAAIEHVADVLAMEAVTGEDYLRDPTLVRTLLATGGATVLSSAVGGPPLSFSSESMGLAATTGQTDNAPIRWAAFAMIALAFMPKVGAAIASLPRVAIGGISILLYGALCVHAIRRLVEARVDAAGPRPLMVIAFMLVLGVGGAQFAADPVALSGVALALAAGVLLNLVLTRRKPAQKGPPGLPGRHS